MVASHEPLTAITETEIIGVYHTDVIDPQELQPVLDRLAGADCVLIENVGGTPDQRAKLTEFFNDISEGFVEPTVLNQLKTGKDDYLIHLISELAGSGALILPIDTAEDPGDPVWIALQREKALRLQLQDESLDSVTARKLQLELRELETLTLWNRDARMAEQIVGVEKRLAEVVDEPQNIKVIVGNDHVEGIKQALAYLRDETAARFI